jgi:hypothetical protein
MVPIMMILLAVLQPPIDAVVQMNNEHAQANGSASNEDNLLANPSFEEGIYDPLGWKHRVVCGSTAYTWDSNYSYGGVRSVGILNASSSCNPDNYWYSVDYIEVDLENHSYVFSGFYRFLGASDDELLGAIGLFTYDVTKSSLQTWKLEFPRSEGGWMYIEGIIDHETFGQIHTPIRFIRIGLFAMATENNHEDAEIRFDDLFFGIDENISGNTPPDAPEISGPATGRIREEYAYNFTTTDPDGDPIYLWIQWGEDCPVEEWVGPFESGKTATFTYMWEVTGTYTITARAKDVHDAEGDTGVLPVTMPLVHQTLLEQIMIWMLGIFGITID